MGDISDLSDKARLFQGRQFTSTCGVNSLNGKLIAILKLYFFCQISVSFHFHVFGIEKWLILKTFYFVG